MLPEGQRPDHLFIDQL